MTTFIRAATASSGSVIDPVVGDDKYHYTYFLNVDSGEDERKLYIGVRTSTKPPMFDGDYLGSSKHLCKWIKENGADKVSKEILAIWGNRKEAVQHEMLLHQIFDVAKNPKFWNRSIQKTDGFDTAGIISAQRGKKFQGAVHPLKGRPKPRDQVEKMRLSQLGKKLSDKTKAKIGEAHKGKKRKATKCPNCNKVGAGGFMAIYHFDNCTGYQKIYRADAFFHGKKYFLGRFPTMEIAQEKRREFYEAHGVIQTKSNARNIYGNAN